MLQKIKVGEKYPGGYKQEGIKLDYDKGFTLYIFLSKITDKETYGFKKGKYKFVITEEQGILFFLVEFEGALTMSDVPFNFGLYQDVRIKDLPKDLESGQGFALTIIVVDTSDGIIKAIRYIGLSHNFSQKLIEICVEQSKGKVDKRLYNQRLKFIQEKYTADDLYKKSIVECKG